MSLRRRVAIDLVRYANLLMPDDRRDWSKATLRELDEIENDRAALSWAMGIFSVSLSERIAPPRRVGGILRWAIVLIVFYQFWSPLGISLFSFGCRLGWQQVCVFLMPDGVRFDPPLWLLTVWILPSATFLAAATLLAMKHTRAPWVFASGFVMVSIVRAVRSHLHDASFLRVGPASESAHLWNMELTTPDLGVLLALAIISLWVLLTRRSNAGPGRAA